MTSFATRFMNWSVPLHLPFREWHMFAKILFLSAISQVLRYLEYVFNYVTDIDLIQPHTIGATTVFLVVIASAVSEIRHQQRYEWRGVLVLIGAFAAFVFVYTAGGKIAAIEATPNQEVLPLASIRVMVCVIAWLFWDAVIVPRDFSSPKQSGDE